MATKNGVIGNQPVVAIQKEPELWLIIGGTWKTFSSHQCVFPIMNLNNKYIYPEFKYSDEHCCLIYEGKELLPGILNLCDFVYPLEER